MTEQDAGPPHSVRAELVEASANREVTLPPTSSGQSGIEAQGERMKLIRIEP